MQPTRKKGKMPNDLALSNVVHWKHPVTGLPMDVHEDVPKLPLLVRAGIRTGVTVANPETPKGWNWNPQNVAPIITILTFFVVVLGLVAGGAWYLGVQYNEMQHMQRQLDKAAEDADKAKQLGSYKAGAADAQRGHVEAEQPAPKKSPIRKE